MDGSSKFIKGDAVAGIIITIINIIGGFAIGSFQHGLDMATSAQYYTILTIGDGLVSQIRDLSLQQRLPLSSQELARTMRTLQKAR
ncbi:FHIPEP family type III secretion protein [Campylobacter concisus]